jgi:hypothetical protein
LFCYEDNKIIKSISKKERERGGGGREGGREAEREGGRKEGRKAGRKKERKKERKREKVFRATPRETSSRDVCIYVCAHSRTCVHHAHTDRQACRFQPLSLVY